MASSPILLFLFLNLQIILLIQVLPSDSFLSTTDLDKPYKITFPQGLSERDLEECQDNFSPCSVIQNPFFFPFIVKRLCRCKKKECPDTFEVKRSLDTVFVNNREQLKFCDDLPKCYRGWSVLSVKSNDDIPYHLNCFCPPKRRYWRLLRSPLPNKPPEIPVENTPEDEQAAETERYHHSELVDAGHHRSHAYHYSEKETKFFKCEKMEPCRNKKCGTFRPDLFATYQNCTCASGSLCLPNRNTLVRVTLDEALYSAKNGRFSTCIRSQPPPSPSK